MSTKQWSTATLQDGVQHVQSIAKQEIEESESDLERELQDYNTNKTKNHMLTCDCFGDIWYESVWTVDSTLLHFFTEWIFLIAFVLFFQDRIPEEVSRQIAECGSQDAAWIRNQQYKFDCLKLCRNMSKPSY